MQAATPTNTQERPPSREQVADPRTTIGCAWKEFQSVAQHEKRTDLVTDLEPSIQRCELGLFRLVVMGEIKKGKSTFINALLSLPDLLPTASDVATSTVFKLIYGPEKRLKVFFLPDVDTNRRPEPQEIEAAGLRDFGTEAGNPGNHRRVDFIGIELPHPLLKEGLIIVDTPGVGGLFKAHRDITWRYAPNADAICFVLDSVESVISKDEIDFLKELTAKVTRKVFFVQTKTDATDLETWRAWEKRNKEHLSNHLGMPLESLLYFPVSSKRKLLADAAATEGADDQDKLLKNLDQSGFPAVMKFLTQGLMQQKEIYLAQQTAEQLRGACEVLTHQLRGQLQIAQAQSKEELDRVAAKYGEAERALTTWEREVFPPEMRRFEDEFAALKLQTTGRLRTEIDVGSVSSFIGQLHGTDFDPEVANARAGEIQQDLLATMAERALLTEQEFQSATVRLVEETATRLAAGFIASSPTVSDFALQTVPIDIQNTLNVKFNGFEKLRHGMMGLGVGVGVVTLLTVVFPPAGAIAGLLTFAAACIGGTKGLEQLAEQKRAEVLARLQQRCTELMARASNQAQQHFAELSQQLERWARNTFTEAAKRARSDLQNRLQDISAARKRSAQESQSQVKELQARVRAVEGVIEILTPLLGKAAKKPG
jgi:GTP-binding protein EngB required for normal cell division